MTDAPHWSDMTIVMDPGVGQVITTLHPAFTITFHMRMLNLPALSQLYQRAMDLMQPELTHYDAEDMKRPAKATAKTWTMVPAWLRKPKRDHVYQFNAYGGKDLGVAPPAIELMMTDLPQPVPAFKQARLRSLLGTGDLTYPLNTSLRLSFAPEHPLANGDALLAWLVDLQLLRTGSFIFAESGYGLLSLGSPFGGITEQKERALLSRHPGLDVYFPAHTSGMFRVGELPSGELEYIPLVKRASWTTALHELTVDYLGGADKIRAELADESRIRVVSLPHGLIIQAGARPQLGDLNKGDYLPLQRRVAKVLRPARVEKLAEKSEFWHHFFNIFDKSYD
jgi:Protein of unknown function (DUF3396)